MSGKSSPTNATSSGEIPRRSRMLMNRGELVAVGILRDVVDAELARAKSERSRTRGR